MALATGWLHAALNAGPAGERASREEPMPKMKLCACSVIAALVGVPLAPAHAQKHVAILYDAFGPPSALKMDWGFAALIQYGGRRILFPSAR